MNYYTSLVKQIDQLKAQGKEVKLTTKHTLFKLIMLNYLEQYGVSKGYSVRELHESKVNQTKSYPDRYDSYEEYIDALHDYLNGM